MGTSVWDCTTRALSSEACDSHTKPPEARRTRPSPSSFPSTTMLSSMCTTQNWLSTRSATHSLLIVAPPPPSSTATTSGAPKSDSPTMPHELHHLTSAVDVARKRNQPFSWKSSRTAPLLVDVISVHPEPNCAVPCSAFQVPLSLPFLFAFSASARSFSFSSITAISLRRSSLSSSSGGESSLEASFSTTLFMTRRRWGGRAAGSAQEGHAGEAARCLCRHTKQHKCSFVHAQWASMTSLPQRQQRYSSRRCVASAEDSPLDSRRRAHSAAEGRRAGSLASIISSIEPSRGLTALPSAMVRATRSWLKAKTPPAHRSDIGTPVRSSASMQPSAQMSSLLSYGFDDAFSGEA
mmetsp:Transcript_73099/g.152652  ORF Transcript_73099/g.152652 Transcript_73099/m.152652 type:complete len:351 (+) Transcript_73099:76-1128(+)